MADDDGAGVYRKHYESGQIEFEIEFIHGKLNGRMIRYYETGQVWFEASLQDNLFQGPFMRYYPDGTPKEQGTYLNGQYHDLITRWNEEGEQLYQIPFHEGEPVEQ